jgi:hypothetical protein
MFLAQFREKSVSESSVSRRKEPDMEEFVGSGIDSGVQPVPLVV